MKKILITILMAVLFTPSVYSQEIFMEILSKSRSIATNENGNPLVRQFAQFKCDALEYLIIKMREEMPDSSALFLDKQAFALNTFIDYYTRTVINLNSQPESVQIKVIKQFMDVSLSNPLFNDKDLEIIYAYVNDGNSLTRFSLDTDWRRASAAIYNLREKSK